MVVRDKIVEMRKAGKGLNQILKSVMEYKPFVDLDELVNLSFIIETLRQNEFEVRKEEVRKVFDKQFSKKFHGEKSSYLKFLLEKLE